MSGIGAGNVSRVRSHFHRRPKPYCHCKDSSPSSRPVSLCRCGEDHEEKEWTWAYPRDTKSWVFVADDLVTVTFHPYYSSGTASVRGNMPMTHNHCYYWEVKVLTDMYGTDIMIGLCSDKAVLSESQFEFKSLLGEDSESYGLSYRGEVRHGAKVVKESVGFGRGSIVGVRLDMWSGTMEFYINRMPQGTSFYNLRRHAAVYPTVCSTAAKSSMRLIHAVSWKASLQLEALKTLNASISVANLSELKVPPGLWRLLKEHTWLKLHKYRSDETRFCSTSDSCTSNTAALLSDVLPSQYVNGLYLDNVDRNYRVVLWE